MSGETVLFGQSIRFVHHRAQIQQIKFWNETHVSSSGGEGVIYEGYGYIAPLTIHSRNQQWQRVHVKWEDGKTGVVTVPGWVGISEGDEVTFLGAVNEETKKWGWQGLTNHSADHWYAFPSGAEIAKFVPKGFFDHYSVVLVQAGLGGGVFGHLLCTGVIWLLVAFLFSGMGSGALAVGLVGATPFFLYGIFRLIHILTAVTKDQAAFNEAVNAALRASLAKVDEQPVAEAVPAQ